MIFSINANIAIIATCLLSAISTTNAVGYKCVGPIHAQNTHGKATAAGVGVGLAGAGAGAAAGAAAGSFLLPGVGTAIGGVVGGVVGLVEGGTLGEKAIRFHGSAYQCMNYGGVCCTGNLRGTQDFIVGQDMYDNVPCRHCWGSIRRKTFLRE